MCLGGIRAVKGAAWVLVALALVLVGRTARAEDAALRAVLFGSLDAGPSVFSTAGAKLTFDRFDRDGFATLGTVGAGARLERGPATSPILIRTTLTGSALGGYQTFHDWGVLGLFAGPEVAFEALTGAGGSTALPARYGLRVQGEVWARPSADTLATGTLVLGSARWDVYGRVSGGYRLLPSLTAAYFGPEASLYADRTGYAKAGLGLHATDFAYGRVSFRFSAGCLYEPQVRRLGPYLALAGWMPL